MLRPQSGCRHKIAGFFTGLGPVFHRLWFAVKNVAGFCLSESHVVCRLLRLRRSRVMWGVRGGGDPGSRRRGFHNFGGICGKGCGKLGFHRNRWIVVA